MRDLVDLPRTKLEPTISNGDVPVSRRILVAVPNGGQQQLLLNSLTDEGSTCFVNIPIQCVNGQLSAPRPTPGVINPWGLSYALVAE